MAARAIAEDPTREASPVAFNCPILSLDVGCGLRVRSPQTPGWSIHSRESEAVVTAGSGCVSPLLLEHLVILCGFQVCVELHDLVVHDVHVPREYIYTDTVHDTVVLPYTGLGPVCRLARAATVVGWIAGHLPQSKLQNCEHRFLLGSYKHILLFATKSIIKIISYLNGVTTTVSRGLVVQTSKPLA